VDALNRFVEPRQEELTCDHRAADLRGGVAAAVEARCQALRHRDGDRPRAQQGPDPEECLSRHR
jgi:hypothetical protein